MENNTLEKLKYPIGKFQAPTAYTSELRGNLIKTITDFPALLRSEIEGLPAALWEQTYRPGGWNLRQVVHHVADSHLNAYVRFKWALTEDAPVIKDYDEDLWVKTPEIDNTPPAVSVDLLEMVHLRWSYIFKDLEETTWQRKFIHPVSKLEYSLNMALALYAWHGKHHLNHIRIVKQQDS